MTGKRRTDRLRQALRDALHERTLRVQLVAIVSMGRKADAPSSNIVSSMLHAIEKSLGVQKP